MDNVNIREKFPHIYEGFIEIGALSSSEQIIFTQGESEYLQLVNNQWVLTANVEGLEEYENMFDILPDPSDSIQLRRERLINRLSTAPPYTFRYLQQRLNSFLGSGNYIITLIPDEYYCHFIVHVGEIGKLDELIKIFVEIIPANLIRVVQNDILCYNNTRSYIAAGMSFGQCYLLTADFNLSYEGQGNQRVGSHIVDASAVQVTSDFSKTEILDGKNHVGSSGFLNTIYKLS